MTESFGVDYIREEMERDSERLNFMEKAKAAVIQFRNTGTDYICVSEDLEGVWTGMPPVQLESGIYHVKEASSSMLVLAQDDSIEKVFPVDSPDDVPADLAAELL